jgi:transmembrane sensor
MSPLVPTPDQTRRLEEAAAWRLRLTRDPACEFSSDYIAWSADLDNQAAMAAIEKGWSAIGALSTSPELLSMRQQALSRLRKAGASPAPRFRWGRAAAAGLAMTPTSGAAAALVVALLGAGLYRVALLQPDTYRTEIGERRVVALADGSRISMDSDSKILVDYSKTERALTLARGRARFDVAHDTSRPFTVTAGAETVVAVGTSFDVERLGSTVLVTLIQGQVVVKDEQGRASSRTVAKPHSAVSLNAGQQLVASAASVQPAVATADLQVAAAWEGGHLVFRDEPLEAVVARINRYTEHPVTLDPAVAGIRISGVFNAGDVGSFVSALTSYVSVQATTNASGGILLQPRL